MWGGGGGGGGGGGFEVPQALKIPPSGLLLTLNYVHYIYYQCICYLAEYNSVLSAVLVGANVFNTILIAAYTSVVSGKV